MLMDRARGLSSLWIGATLINAHHLPKQARYLLRADLNATAWSGTVHSFIQEPVTTPLATRRFVSRADERRLLFLGSAEFN
ncbi:hypothetical protein B0T25DRAFT_223307 [Lasiosphaeria hispida]|uniref:Uncharacterized protein n=1 Tax=Lasiosphaeria hispida TaxID=260671 RepID=A0AAJ0MF76_9PEZI|nr:hypothetical protein B0T25DRAFT_223307 [Lasiosphaeria hispida]